MSKLYVGNLSWNTTTDSLKQAFEQFGQVVDAIVMTDRETGRSRGFAFVTFSSEEEATAAQNAMNEQDLDGRRIRVNVAEARPPRSNYNGGGAPGGRW
ncbi:Nucleotide-binding alpha-beta plait [Penicillium verhagenii]|uniref:Nucleotide-binding alpha-beta plait n=1 Tax=Penicillium verhagenii TaxID=1562060 RepID=UPI002545B7C5|nr:Nucleotide-binding alpha-beta plait [Penicillium verhagenii]KAJ5929861.1 Nucleotide-binding alpha-beta plait [Penicillium verhagenii]KAJ5935843.1 Nucleotide-binding alpha-beta plait [Penicillium verhagenii]